MTDRPIDPRMVKWDDAPQADSVQWDQPEQDKLKAAAPYYLGPAGTLRAGRDALKFVDDVTTRVGYKAGEVATDAGTALGLSPEVAAGGGVVANMAGQGAVSGALGSLVRAPALLEKGARVLMQSAIKPNQLARTSGKADAAITTMLEKNIPATEAGRDMLKTRVADLETEIQGILNNSPAVVDKHAVAATLKDAFDKVKHNLSVNTDNAAISNTFQTFLNHPLLQGSSQVPVNVANRMKQAIYKSVSDKAYGPNAAAQSAEILAEKTLARGLKENVGRAEPAVLPPMEEQKELLRALKVLEPRIGVEGNKNIIGLGTLSPSVEQAVIWLVDRSPWFKSQLAQSAYHSRKRLPQEAATAAVAAESGVRQTSDPLPPMLR